jgi:type II secretory pathway predicted ATPase ExeA
MNARSTQFINTPFGAFTARHSITLGELAELAGGVSKSTVHRLIQNNLKPSTRQQVEDALKLSLPDFLFKKGLSAAEIDQQLIEIFSGDYEPMISQRIELTPDEQRYFGLAEDPFTHVPQSRDEVFISPPLQQVIDRVIDAVRYQGFVCLTGEIGSGKSTLRALVEDHVMANKNMRIVWPEFFDMKMVTPMQIAEAILDAFEMRVPRSSGRRGLAVKKLLASLYQDGTRVALGFDECHRLNDSALSSLKNFLEMSSGGFQRYLGVILFGQPIFESRLRDHRFREIVERVVPLKMPEFSDSARGYLKHRLSLVGGDIDKLFDKESIDLICRQATTPLQLGNIANEAMRISKADFGNNKVIGAAIKTQMFFDKREPQAFKKRA